RSSDLQGGQPRSQCRDPRLYFVPVPESLVEGMRQMPVRIQQVRDLDQVGGCAMIEPPEVADVRSGLLAQPEDRHGDLYRRPDQVNDCEAVAEFLGGQLRE